LAIINLINTYAEYFDQGDIDEWIALFTVDPKVTVHMGNAAPVTVSGQAFKEFFGSFREKLEKEMGVIPRHLVTNVSVKQQSASEAEVAAYITYIPLDKDQLYTPVVKSKINITGTALYKFQAEKGADGIWRIREYTIRYDQTNV
jgi:hypothetical protein